MTVTERENSIGLAETQYFSFAYPSDEMVLESGEKLGPITVAYETYGRLNQEKSNAILVLHALSGDAHAAGFHDGEDTPGWWDNLIGPGKGFDTDKYFIICSNVLGGCKGSTGPASINPATGNPYGLDFPLITIRDIVSVQAQLVRHLGIEKLLCVAGGSMGGMQTLQWAASYPDMIRSAIPIATTLRHSPQQIAFNEVGRQAIMADPDWNNGNYYGKAAPGRGLAVARMVGHITYMSDVSMAEKFGRRVKSEKPDKKFSPDFEVEGYLQYRGDNFVKRFDANSYLYITKALDRFDLINGSSIESVLRPATDVRFLVLAFKSDWLYPAYQSVEIVRACRQAQIDVSYAEIHSSYGHDAFLLEIDEEEHFIKNFLRRVADEQ